MELQHVKSKLKDETHQKHASQYARSLIEASLDPLVAISIEGKITDMNQATVNITGVTRKKLTGSDFFDYFTEPQKAREVYQAVFAKGFVADSPLTLRHKNGKLTDVLFNGSVYKDDKGNVLGVVIVARDVTAQKADKQLKANRANKELAFQNKEKGKRADELIIANKELAFQNEEKEKRADELIIANKELAFQNEEKEKRANELIIANKELVFQNKEKEKRAAELIIANEELLFQNKEKEKRAAELIIANKELLFQNKEKEKRANELVIADIELDFQNKEKEKRETANIELEALSKSLKQASQYARSLLEASTDPLVTISPEGKITDVNEASVKVTGVKRERLIGTDFSDYFTEPEKAREGYKMVFKKSFVSDYPLTIRHKNGTLTDVLYNASVYKDEKGDVLGVFAAARDVTEKKRAEANLRRSLKEISGYKMALDQSSIVAVTDHKGIINYANDNFCTISKYKREELIGKDHRIINSGFHAKVFIAEMWETIKGGHIWRGELKNKAKDGTIYWVDTTIVPFLNDEGEAYQYVAIRADITAKKLLSQYSLSLIEASRDPLVTISLEGKITDMNEAMVNVTGVSREKLKGTDFKDYFTDSKKASEVYQEVFNKGFVADYPLTIKDHKLTDVLFNGSIYKDDRGVVLGAVIVARDITEQKRIEKELIEAKDLAEKLAGAKDQFLASMSHEIRTPLNGIIGFTKILLRNETTAKQRYQLDAIKTSSDILLVLINDILDLSKIEAGKMNIETTELKLTELVNSVLSSFELRFQEKELKISKKFDNRIPKILRGDPVRINQIVLNLLSNSVKFTEDGGQIGVAMNLLSEDQEISNIEIIISDSGIGISEEKLDVIFKPFIQSSSDTARKYGGTGLGLSIVKQLVDLMGGTVTVQSEINQGCSFTIILPLMKSSATDIAHDIESKIHSDEIQQLGMLKILLAEDIPINQFLAQTILHDFGFETDTAENGKIAIELLEKNDYDIVLMDLMMPEMNGFEATLHIRNKMAAPKCDIPIIALTADVTKADVDKCTEVGMNEYVSKPINETDLLNKISRLVKKHAAVEIKKYCNLDYLKSYSPNNPKFVGEIVKMFLEQTPKYVSQIKHAITKNDWVAVHGNSHKIRPSVDLIGMPKEIATLVKQVEDYAHSEINLDLIPSLFSKVEKAFKYAYEELELELKNTNDSKIK